MGREFILASFFPVALFFIASVTLYLEATIGLKNALSALEGYSIITQTILLLSFIGVVTTISYLLHNLQQVILRLFQGYWFMIPPLTWFRAKRRSFYERWTRHRFEEASELFKSPETVGYAHDMMSELLDFMPPSASEEFRPTRLGNIMRATEIYMQERYGLDAAIIWPKLRFLLKPETLAVVEDKRVVLHFSVLMMLLTVIFTLMWSLWLLMATARPGLFLIVSLSGCALQYIVYRNVIQSAVSYGEQIKAVFDIYRYELFNALNHEPSYDIVAERNEWQALSIFFRNNYLPPPLRQPVKSIDWNRMAEAFAAYLEKNMAPNSNGTSKGNP